MIPWKLQEATYKKIGNLSYEVAVLPWGSTEPHGYHLPYGNDTLHTEALASRTCAEANKKGAKVVLLPTIPYGVNSNTLEFPLVIHMSFSTQLAIIKDIVRSLEVHKINKLVIFNGHGGNAFRPIMRELYGTTEVFICAIDWWKVAQDKGEEIFEDPTGEHGNEMETSVSLSLFPDLVHMEDAGTGKVRKPTIEAFDKGWAFFTRPWHLLTYDSGHGDPRKASQEKGERYVDIIVKRLSKFLRELSQTPIDQNFPYASDS